VKATKRGGEATLVTGGSGFIGRAAVARLVRAGIRTRVLDTRPLPDIPEAGAAECILGSILDDDALRRAMDGADRVIHAAAYPHLWAPDSRFFERVNAEGTRRVLAEARRRGVRQFVHTSTEAVLRGPGDRGEAPIREDDPLPPLAAMAGPYTRSKWLAERAVRQAAEEGFPAVIVYPTVPLGPGDDGLTAPTRMIRSFAVKPPPFYLECALNVVAVEDAAEGHVRALERGLPGERFLLGGENVRLSRLLELIAEATGRPPPRRAIPYPLAWLAGWFGSTAGGRLGGEPPLATLEGTRLARRLLWCDNRRARERLGLEPVSAKEAIRRSLAWLRETGRL